MNNTPTTTDLINLGQAMNAAIEAGQEWRTLYSEYNTMSRMLDVPASHLQGYSDSDLRVELARVIHDEELAVERVTWMRKRHLEASRNPSKPPRLNSSEWEKRFYSEMATLGTIKSAIISKLEPLSIADQFADAGEPLGDDEG
tara:strand:+ start:558 stop:986 length:429 start_codon:yes stop_codon:yes gene_type:complete